MQIEEEEDEIFVFLNNKTSHRLSTTNTDDGDATVALAAATETIAKLLVGAVVLLPHTHC